MQAFLIVGTNKEDLKTKTGELAKSLHAKMFNFPIAKIEDTRNLNDLLRLSFNEPTLIVCENIENATDEALNAFLKNLEEPQENIYIALTSASVKKVLPTIVSRCQIIITKNTLSDNKNEDAVKQFLEMSPGQRLAFFDKQSLAIRSTHGKIKDRDWAIDFIESLIFFLHERSELTNMELLLKTRTCLKANGAVNLHLTNFVIHYGK